MSTTISIPLSILTWPFTAVFAVVRWALVVAFLASGVGAIVAMATKGFSWRYVVTRTEPVEKYLDGLGGGLVGVIGKKYTFIVVPGWALCRLGLKTRTRIFYADRKQLIWVDETGAAVSQRLAYKLLGAATWHEMCS